MARTRTGAAEDRRPEDASEPAPAAGARRGAGRE